MKSRTKTTIILELTFEEANWLKKVMQNPFIPDTRKRQPKENPTDRMFREKFFNAYEWPGDL